MTIGDHLWRGRLDRGLRIVDVARTLGVTEWTVINWERGRTMPAVRFLPRVIAFLGFEP